MKLSRSQQRVIELLRAGARLIRVDHSRVQDGVSHSIWHGTPERRETVSASTVRALLRRGMIVSIRSKGSGEHYTLAGQQQEEKTP